MAEEENEQNQEQVTEEATEAPAEKAPAAEASPPAPATPVEEAAPPISPKERRRLKRSTHKGETTGPELSGDERAERRVAERKRKADSRRRYRHGRGAKHREAEQAAKGPGTPPADREPGMKKTQQGIVVSNKADKTITVRVESARRHPTYEKIIRRSKMLHAHDESNEAGPGDTVLLVETRPMSKTKRWRLTEIVEKAR